MHASAPKCAAACIVALALIATVGFMNTEHAATDEVIAAEASITRSHHQTLKNVQNLKAYCVAANDQAIEAKDGHASMKHSAVVDLVTGFGKLSKKNPISEYGHVMGALKNKYKMGVGRYMLHHLDKNIIYGKGVTTTKSIVKNGGRGLYVFIDPRMLGIKYHFGLTHRIAARFSKYENIYQKVAKATKNADSQAAAAWLVSGAQGRYKSFSDRLQAYWSNKRRQWEGRVTRSGVRAENKAFVIAARKGHKGAKLVYPQTPAGKRNARNAPRFKRPSAKDIIKAAKKKAQAWLARAKSAMTPKKVIRQIERKVDGVTIRVRTGMWKNAQSSMRPKLYIRGTRGSIKGSLRSVPGRGKTRTQTFTARKSIGKIHGVILHATCRPKPGRPCDGWLVNKLEVKVGGGKFKRLYPGGHTGMVWLDRSSRRAKYGGFSHASTLSFGHKRHKAKKAKKKAAGKSCPMQKGFCVKRNNHDQNHGVIKISSRNGNTKSAQASCLRSCKARRGATGCEVIWHQGNRGCYVHTRSIARGNNAPRHLCWVFSQCKTKKHKKSKKAKKKTAKHVENAVKKRIAANARKKRARNSRRRRPHVKKAKKAKKKTTAEMGASCAKQCKAKRFCCNDFRSGSNQFLSCSQACMIRARGGTLKTCKAACSSKRRCHFKVGGHTYGACSRCKDLARQCPHGVQSTSACKTGCHMRA